MKRIMIAVALLLIINSAQAQQVTKPVEKGYTVTMPLRCWANNEAILKKSHEDFQAVVEILNIQAGQVNAQVAQEAKADSIVAATAQLRYDSTAAKKK